MKHSYRVEWKGSMSEIPKQAWDALAEPLPTPALEWEWLGPPGEPSGSVCPDTGWLPAHLTVWQGAELAAAAPAVRERPQRRGVRLGLRLGRGGLAPGRCATTPSWWG